MLTYIEENEKVGDLNTLCEQGPSAQLDAFAYTYTGTFQSLAQLGRTPKVRDHPSFFRQGGIAINEAVLRDGPEEIILSKRP